MLLLLYIKKNKLRSVAKLVLPAGPQYKKSNQGHGPARTATTCLKNQTSFTEPTILTMG